MDPFGLQQYPTASEGHTVEIPVEVRTTELPLPEFPHIPELLQRPPDLSGIQPSFGGLVGPSGGGRGGGNSGSRGSRQHTSASRTNSTNPQQPPPQNPPSPSNLPSLGLSSVLQGIAVEFPDGTQSIPMTKIKNTAQQRALGKARGTMIPILVPDGVNPQQIIDFWSASSTLFPLNLPAFTGAFMPGGLYDFKLPSRGGGPIYDAFGNFLYGASGEAAGISALMLQGVGDLIHGGQNDPINVGDINTGIYAIRLGGMIKLINVDLSDF
jgi:hypothetical protein